MTEPTYIVCGRCQRLKLKCRIDANFKRIGKRSKNAEMEKEIVDLRRQLASQQTSPTGTGPAIKTDSSNPTSPILSTLPTHMPATIDQFMGSQDLGSEEAVQSLIDMKTGGSALRTPNAQIFMNRQIGDVILTPDQVSNLFRQ